MDATIQVRERGVVTLPSELRQKYNIENGNIFKLVDLDGIFVFVPMTPIAPELAREIERLRLEAGISMEELLQGLRTQREKYNQENYGG
jgi:bifunctional DNA-binding transcriptional regulator/antitoxin component of YhaV-PrlF toxin-antitoxin module